MALFLEDHVALNYYMPNWTLSLDEHLSTDVVYFDFSKAFDSVPHARLLLKLQAYGINGQLLKWFESFLTGRRQYVKVNSASSSWTQVSSGVPQGSVLGPLLFVLYINELPSLVSSQLLMFADDIKLYRCIRSPKDYKMTLTFCLTGQNIGCYFLMSQNVRLCTLAILPTLVIIIWMESN